MIYFLDSGQIDDVIYKDGEYLTEEQKKQNAKYIYNYLKSKGWSTEAIAALLGNMEAESTLNPILWQGRSTQDDIDNRIEDGSMDINEQSGDAYGLVQWDPPGKLINWAVENGYDYKNIDTQLERIEYERENPIDSGGQWSPAKTRDTTFTEFSQSTANPEILAIDFLYSYEKPAKSEETETERKNNAQKWYTYLTTELDS